MVGIVTVSTQFASRTQYLILAIVVLSLISIFIASFPIFGQAGFTETPVLWGEFNSPELGDFWSTFAVFFPAVTGIMVGISLSGALENPHRSIPQGTLWAIAITLVIYLLLTYWLARVATPEELLANETIMADKAFWNWAVLAGVLGATFSSALGSLVAAPRVMQALAQYGVLPFSDFFTKETLGGEPRNAMLATAVVGLAALLFGFASSGLNAISEILTMFFLITYGMLNVVVLIEQTLAMVSFRPTIRIPRIIPFVGMTGCTFAMFIINPSFSLVAVVLVLAIYGYLVRQQLKTLDTDVRSGLFTAMVEWAMIRAQSMPTAPERTWKPTVLAPVSSSRELTGSYRFLWAMTAPQGRLHTLGIFPAGERQQVADLEMVTQAFVDDGMFAQTTLLEEDDFTSGVRAATQMMRRAFFRPNILFLHLRPSSDPEALQRLIDRTSAYNIGIVLLARDPVVELGREQLINVWVTPQGPDWQHDLRSSNLDLATLIAYKLVENWHGRMNLCMAVKDAATQVQAEQFLRKLIDMARLSSDTQVHVFVAPFEEALTTAPHADLSVFGLSRKSNLAFSQRIMKLVGRSCVFVRDSGEESALA